MYLRQVDFATPAFDRILALRDQVLRKPLNMAFTPKQISAESDDFHFGCYTNEGLLIGTLLMKVISKNTLKMRQVAVSPNSQNQGVGSFMIKQIEAWIGQHTAYTDIELAARQEAVVFYQRLGYKVQGKPFTEVGIPHRHMTKRL